MRSLFTILAALLLALPSLAFDVRGTIILGGINNSTLSPQSKVSLDHGIRKALIRQDGTFTISNVDNGKHILQVQVPGYTFSEYLLTISETSSPHVQFYHPAKLPLSTSSPSLPYPLEIYSSGREEYFTNPNGMNVFGMLKNPMVLMMLFSAVMMYFMPKLMSSMDIDPEMAKEMAETRKKMQGMQNMDWAGSLSNMLAGTSEEPPKIANTVVATSGSGTSTPSKTASGNAGKRRKGR